MGWHWVASSVGGFILTGRFRPLCSIIYTAPDCRARRAALRALDRAFSEQGHARRVHLTYVIGDALKRKKGTGAY